MARIKTKIATFWHWFFRGTGGRAGITRLGSWWIALDAFLGLFLSVVIPATSLEKTSTSVLIPLSGIFIGVSAVALQNLQNVAITEEITELAAKLGGGAPDVMYPLYIGVLLILVCFCIWGAIGLTILPDVRICVSVSRMQICSQFLLFLAVAITSLTVRACWRGLVGVSYFVFAIHEIRQKDK